MKFELVICIYNGVKSGQDDPPLQLLENLLLILWLKKKEGCREPELESILRFCTYTRPQSSAKY